MTHIYQGVVINQRSFKDDDLLIDIYTAQRGKLTVLVKGGRKILSKLRSGIEILNWVEVMVAEGRSFSRLAAANSLAVWPRLRKNLTNLSLALALVEIVDKITVEAVKEDEICYLLLRWFEWLENNRPSEEEGLFWLYLLGLRLLARAGYGLPFTHCFKCEKLFDPQLRFYFSSSWGVVCENCHHTFDLLLDKKLYDLLNRFLYEWSLDQVGDNRIFVDYQEVGEELRAIGEWRLKQVVERQLSVFALLSKIN